MLWQFQYSTAVVRYSVLLCSCMHKLWAGKAFPSATSSTIALTLWSEVEKVFLEEAENRSYQWGWEQGFQELVDLRHSFPNLRPPGNYRHCMLV